MTGTVDRAGWAAAVGAARDDGFTWFDMLTAVDDGDVLTVVCHLWSPAARAGRLLQTSVPAADPVVESVTGLFAGADWHERETAEMYGLTFAGHPNPVPLLLADPTLHPLRKEHALTRREDG